MSLCVEFVPWFSSPSFLVLISRHVLDKSTAALNFNHFKYDLNTTSCSDNTKCPGRQNQTCCDAKNGKKEIDFGNNAIIPENLKDLSSYYEAAGPSRTVESTGSTAQHTPHYSTTTGSSSTAARGTDPSIGTSASRLSPSSISSDGRDQPSGGSSLSTSARVIVGATVSRVGILLLVSCLYFIRRHRMKHRAVKPGRSIEPEKAEYSQLAVTASNLSELQGSQRWRLP